MIHFIGYFLVLYSIVMVVAFNETNQLMFAATSVGAYIVGCYELFLYPLEGFDDVEL